MCKRVGLKTKLCKIPPRTGGIFVDKCRKSWYSVNEFIYGRRIFSMQAKTAGRSPREMAEQKYASARSNLLLMLILTVVNIVLYVCGSYTMFLFSATVPYLMVVCSTIFFDMPALMIICIGIAAVILIVYLLCWIFSKKSSGWMVFALVLFIVDTVVMIALYVWMQEVSGILDAIIHILVLYYLFIGVRRGAQLPTLPPDEEVSPETPETM